MIKILFIVYDNESYVHTFPHGVSYLISYLESKGFEVDVYSQDIYHYTNQHLVDFLKENYYDIICLGVIGGYFQYKKLLSISKIINNSKNRPGWYILGGHGPSPDPEFFLSKTGADIIVRGEGEETLLELVKRYPDSKYPHKIDGVSYQHKGKFIHNKNRELISDLDSLPFPAYYKFNIEHYKLFKMAHASSTDSVMLSSSPKIGHSISRKWHDPLHTGECHEKKQAQ